MCSPLWPMFTYQYVAYKLNNSVHVCTIVTLNIIKYLFFQPRSQIQIETFFGDRSAYHSSRSPNEMDCAVLLYLFTALSNIIGSRQEFCTFRKNWGWDVRIPGLAIKKSLIHLNLWPTKSEKNKLFVSKWGSHSKICKKRKIKKQTTFRSLYHLQNFPQNKLKQ